MEVTPGGEFDPAQVVLRPGKPPPWLIPFCASCKEGVDSFTLYPLTIEGQVDLEATCHGKTEGVRLTTKDLVKLSVTGIPIVLFKGTLRQLVDVVTAAP